MAKIVVGGDSSPEGSPKIGMANSEQSSRVKVVLLEMSHNKDQNIMKKNKKL